MTTVPVSVSVENIDLTIATYSEIQIYYDTTPDGSFSSQISNSPVTLVADQSNYTANDTAWAAGRWYRYRFYNTTSSAASDYSAPFQATGGVTAAMIRKEAVRLCGYGFAGTASGAGTTAYLPDITLADVGVDTNFLAGTWLYRPNANSANKLRRLPTGGFTVASGRMTPTRAWSSGQEPSDGEPYEVYFLFPPYDVAGAGYSWLRAIQDGLDNCWVPDQFVVVQGDGESRRYSISGSIGYFKPSARGTVWLRRFNDDGEVISPDLDMTKRGMYVNWIENGLDNWIIEMPFPIPSDQYIVCDGYRRFEKPYADSQVTDAPLKLAAWATAWQALKMANFVQGGKYAAATETAYNEFMGELSLYSDTAMTVGV